MCFLFCKQKGQKLSKSSAISNRSFLSFPKRETSPTLMGRVYPRQTKDTNNSQNANLRHNFKAKKNSKAKEIINTHKESNLQTNISKNLETSAERINISNSHKNHQTSAENINNSITHETSSEISKMAEIKVTTDAPKLSDYTLYSDYKDNVILWDIITDIPKAKRGALLLAGIKNEHATFGDNIQRQLFQKYRPTEIAANEESVKLILDFLDSHIGKPSKHLKFQCLREIVEFKRSAGQEFAEYAKHFEYLVSKAENAGLKTLSSDIKAGFLMNNANLSVQQIELLNSVVDLSDDDNLYNNVKSKMFDMLTNVFGLKNENESGKLSDAFMAQHEEAFLTWSKRKNFQNNKTNNYQNNNRTRNAPNNSFRQNNYTNNRNNGASNNSQTQRQDEGPPTNPKNAKGQILQCRNCLSMRHLQAQCPYNSMLKQNKQYPNRFRQAFVIEGQNSDTEDDIPEHILRELEQTELSEKEKSENTEHIFFTQDRNELSKFTAEALNAAALDTCCSSSVTGMKWLNIYMQAIPKHIKHLLSGPHQSKTSFTFGNQQSLTSLGIYKIPIIIANEIHELAIDVINSDIPLLMSKEHMKKLGIAINLINDTATANGKPIKLHTTSAGHYIINLLDQDDKEDSMVMEHIMLIDLEQATIRQQYQMLEKLHRQFGHGSKSKFVDLLKGAEKWHDHFDEMIDKIIDGCEGCIFKKRLPDRPSVAFPMANDFNQCVAMDLKIWKGKPILYMIDCFTRYTVATFLKSKTPEEVVRAFMTHWVRYFQKPREIITDQGNEFTGSIMMEAMSKLDIICHTTAAYSPWSNGLCERNHYLVDNILLRILIDFPDMDLETALAWACVAKNSLSTVYGFSPFQLVYGRVPSIPNIIDEPPNVIEIKSHSKALEDQLKAMHECRAAFMKSQNCEKLKQALRTKMRTAQHNYSHGDYVYYRREKDDKWLGPAKVVYQDGKVICVRHGRYFGQVHANRLHPVKPELTEKIKAEETKAESANNENNKAESAREESHPITQNQTNSSEGTQQTGEEEEPNEEREEETVEDAAENATEERAPNNQQNKKRQGRPAKKNSKPQTAILKRAEKVQIRVDGAWMNATVISSGKRTGKYPNWYNFALENGKILSDDVENIEIRKMEEPRTEREDNEDNSEKNLHEEILAVLVNKDETNTPEALEAKQKELNKLQEFDTYEVIDDEGQEYITTLWVVTKKGEELRARLTAKGFQELQEVPKESPTMHKHTLRIILAIAAANKWKISASDVKSAFLQGNELDRIVLVKPPKEANLAKKLWRLKKCLYGLRDASKKWYEKVRNNLEKLGFKKSMYDSGLFFLQNSNGDLEGLIGIHVDDFIHCGTEYFNDVVLNKVLSAFQIGKSESNSFMYTGFMLKQDEQGISLDQEKYVEGVTVPKIEAKRINQTKEKMTPEELTMIRQMTGAINWCVRATRPDLAFELIEASTKMQGGTVADLKAARKTLTKMKDVSKVRIADLKDLKQVEIWIFTDASFGNLNNGVDSAQGYIMFLVNPKTGDCAPVEWKANKIQRVTNSTLAAETMSLTAGIDAAIATRWFLQEVLGKQFNFPITAIVDNQDAHVAVHSATDVQERRLRREIGMVKQWLTEKEIEKLVWVPGELQAADILTKKGVNPTKIMIILQAGKLSSEYIRAIKKDH